MSFGFSRVSGSLGVSAVLSGFAGFRWGCRVLCALLRVADAFFAVFVFVFGGFVVWVCLAGILLMILKQRIGLSIKMFSNNV